MSRRTCVSLFLAVVASCCCTRAALAQAPNPVATAFRGTLQRAQRNLVADAASTPADEYAYEPTARR